jgi:hypothetical protein
MGEGGGIQAYQDGETRDKIASSIDEIWGGALVLVGWEEGMERDKGGGMISWRWGQGTGIAGGGRTGVFKCKAGVTTRPVVVYRLGAPTRREAVLFFVSPAKEGGSKAAACSSAHTNS